MNKREQAIQEHRIRAAMESEDIWGVKNKQQRERYARKKVSSKNKKTPAKAKKTNKGLTEEEVLDIWNNYNPKYSELSPEAHAEIDKAHKETLASANDTSSKQGNSPTTQNNASTDNNNNTNNNNNNNNKQSSNQANAKPNTGNQTTADQPQSNNVSNNNNNNTKGKASTDSKPTTTKGKLWRTGIPFVADIALNSLNSTSPTNNTLLSRESLMDYTRNQDNGTGVALNVMDAILNPSDSYYWEDAGDWLGDKGYNIWSGIAGLFSDDKVFVNNVGATARDVVKDAVDWTGVAVDLGTYAVPYLNTAKGAYLTSKAVGNNIWDIARDLQDIQEYSYKNLGFNDFSGDSTLDNVLWGAKAGFNNLFSRFGENRDFYQRGRYSLNEMLSAMAKEIENSKDKNSPEYKDLVGKFEKFNNLAKFSDYYWATKKEMDASDLSKEDFLKSKNLSPETFDYFEQNAKALHNLGNNLELNESNGIKRSDYKEGNYSYQDFTKAVDEAKKSLEGDNTDIDTDTLNAFMGMGTDVGKVITGKPVDNTTGTGINNTVNENTQSSLTPDYLTEFYKKFDKTYNYDPAKGRFNIWL